MSASNTSEVPDTKLKPTDCLQKNESRYALYLFSPNKHASSPGIELRHEKRSSTSSSTEFDEPSVCLSLLEGNLNATQETVVRCYLLNVLSSREDLKFENEGKYAVLHSSEESEDTFGCFFHKLSKDVTSVDEEKSGTDGSKQHVFFICMIAPENDVIMESFCSELNAFCCTFVNVLDPEDLKNREDVKLKLNSWYSYCIEYVGRVINKFQNDIPLILTSALWGNVEVITDDEDVKWDLERFIEACSTIAASNLDILNDSSEMPEEISLSLKLKEKKGRIEIESRTLEFTPYCIKWSDKIKNCNTSDHKSLRSILEGFKLKTIQDLNNLKRLLQKAVADYYALFNAYLFLKASGYDEILLYHVKREAHVANEEDVLEVIKCLHEFIQECSEAS